MEDAHIAKFNIAPDVSVFGVFDGHGGIYKVGGMIVSDNFNRQRSRSLR